MRPRLHSGSITVTSGTLNSQALSPSNPRIVVAPGDPITGTVDIHVENNGGAGDIFPVCGTTSWGDHASSGWTIESWLQNPPGAADYVVTIDVTSPIVEGTYYLFFAGVWEKTCGNILSCTNWNNGTGDLWDNGYDVADWTDDQAQNAVDLGWVCSDWLKGGALTQWSIPAAAIRVVVPLVPAQPTSWGKIKALYR